MVDPPNFIVFVITECQNIRSSDFSFPSSRYEGHSETHLRENGEDSKTITVTRNRKERNVDVVRLETETTEYYKKRDIRTQKINIYL